MKLLLPIVGMFFLFSCSSKTTEDPKDEIEILSDAYRAAMTKQRGSTMECDPASFKYVEEYFSSRVFKLKDIDSLKWKMGAYFGECLCSNYEGKWENDSVKQMVVFTDGKSVNPFDVAYRFIMDPMGQHMSQFLLGLEGKLDRGGSGTKKKEEVLNSIEEKEKEANEKKAKSLK